MRRITKSGTNHESGAVGVLAAVMTLVLIGAGALAVDVGQIYAERAQLQNAADAGALAVVQACYSTGCTQSEAEEIAASLADSNSNDAQSNVAEVDLSVVNQVTVRTTTQSAGNSFLSKMFASALDAPPASVGAYAVAAAEPPSGGKGFPLALSECQFDLAEAESEGEVQLISYKPGMDDCTSTSGHEIPGGFGWLDRDGGPCAAQTDADENVSSDPGADYSSFSDECDPILQAWIDEIESGGKALATFPIYDNAGKSGTKGWFHIRGYATFDMQGWKFGGGTLLPRTFRNTTSDVADSEDSCTGKCLGIIGQFVKYESIEDFNGGSGGGADLGTVNVKLID